MFKKILFPTDFSDVSEKALDYIISLKKVGAETVVIIHVIDQRFINVLYNKATMNYFKMEQEMMARATRSLEEIGNLLEDYGFEVKSLLKTGFPIIEILNAEKEENVSIIVIGSHGKSNLKELFLGSVSEKVIRKCEKPVFVVKRATIPH